MRHKLLGPSGLRVSELCLGTMNFGETRQWGVAPAEAEAILGRFVEAGGTFIDMAPNYAAGAAEEIVGRFARGRRDELVLATKFTPSLRAHPLAGGNSRKSLRSAVEGSLRRLGTDHIDLLWLHYWDGTTPLQEILSALNDLVTAGKVLYVGFSDTPAWLISRAATLAELRGSAPVIAVQLEYNLAARTAERELLPMAEALDLGVVAWGPLAAGALAGGPAPQRRAAASLPKPLANAALRLRDIAGEAGRAPLALALRWVMRRASVTPILGARTPDQLGGALACLESSIDEATLTALDGVASPELGFPHELIASAYLRKLALGDPSLLAMPARKRA